MTVAESRDAIVAALDSVEGLSATGYTPAPILPGSAWAVNSRTEALTFCLGVSSWFVFVGVPAANNQASVEFADSLIEPVWDALQSVGKVVAYEPWSWPVETGQSTIPVMRFTMEG